MQSLPTLVMPERSGPLVVYVEYGDFPTVFLTRHGETGSQCGLANTAFLPCNAKDFDIFQCGQGQSYRIIYVYMCKCIRVVRLIQCKD